MSHGYTCNCCGEHKNEIPMSYGTDLPIYVEAMNPKERRERVSMSNATCIIDDEHYFIRGNIYLPVHDSDTDFSWGVWSTLSKASYDIIVANWIVEGRERIVAPAFGYLSTPLPGYPDTMNLNMLVHTLPVGKLPIFELEVTDHPLAVEQRKGITMARVHEITKLMGA